MARRQFCAGALQILATLRGGDGIAVDQINADVAYGENTLRGGIRSRFVKLPDGAKLHFLEAGFDRAFRPCVVLLHGFPELAYTWRNQMLPIASQGYHVVAPDLRGYGLSAPQPVGFNDSLEPYSMLNRVRDVIELARALGYESVAMVVGHDWGGLTAQWCARTNPVFFKSVVSISTPFLSYGDNTPANSQAAHSEVDIDKALAGLTRPRKHYFTYNASQAANEDMWHPPQGLRRLLREFYYVKSADWKGNQPFPLKGWTASELSKLPTYYVMDLNKNIGATMAEHQPSAAEVLNCHWLTESDLDVYTAQFSTTGFQGGLNYYRVDGDPELWTNLEEFKGRTIRVPSCYIGGAKDWAVYQSPGAFESMGKACERMHKPIVLARAGHSLVEERPTCVNESLIEFLRATETT